MFRIFRPTLTYNFFFLMLIATLSYGYATYERYQQYQAWEKAKPQYFVGETPMMATYDAYHWLRWAQVFKDGKHGTEGPDQLRFFPDGTGGHSGTVPMLSYLIAKLSTWFSTSGDSLYWIGFTLIPILASLFILPLCWFFHEIRFPAAGILGGLVGSLSHEYLVRTSVARVDTDALNLFFPFLCSALIIKAALSNSNRKMLLYSALAGFSMYLFGWWYARPAFATAYAGVLIATLLVNQLQLRKKEEIPQGERFSAKLKYYLQQQKFSFVALIVFIVFANPMQVWTGTSNARSLLGTYFQISDTMTTKGNSSVANQSTEQGEKAEKYEAIQFPNVLKTISEAQEHSVRQALASTLASPHLSGVGLISFFIFFLLHWKRLLPLLPVLLVGLLVFQSGRRFAMFLSPFVGIGFGFLLTILLQLLWEQIKTFLPAKKEDSQEIDKNAETISEVREEWRGVQNVFQRFRDVRNWIPQVLIYFCAFFFFFTISDKTAIHFVPQPSVPPFIYQSFVDMKNRLPANSAIYTWWDYGYAITQVTEQATFHDGSSQASEKTYFVARSLTSQNQQEMYNIVNFLSTNGNRGILELINQPMNIDSILKYVNEYSNPLAHQNIYVMYTLDMVMKLAAIHSLGQWDFQAKSGRYEGYNVLRCHGKIEGGILNCDNAQLNLDQGRINGNVPIVETIIVNNGYVARRVQYPNQDGVYVQLLVREGQLIQVQVLTPAVYRSNFNQMYLLGEYNKNLFEEYYNAFPTARVFRVKDNIPLSKGVLQTP